MEVRLVPMTDEEYGPFIERLIPEYAADHVADGQWSPEESLAGARKEVERLLPQGKATATERFLTIVAGTPEERVGYIWVHFQKQNGFVYDLWVHESQRRKGYARAGMLALERYATQQGAARLALHVFAHNGPARELYRTLGYQETNVVMSKGLD
jgi:ribosomal protein S18 acetylase RimI-like enzyme